MSKSKFNKQRFSNDRDHPVFNAQHEGKSLHHFPKPVNWVKEEFKELRTKNKVVTVKSSKKKKLKNKPFKFKSTPRKPDSNSSIQKLSIKQSQAPNQDKVSQASKRFMCYFCVTAFDSLSELNGHMQIHPICPSCGKRMLNDEILKKHIQMLL